MWNGDRLIVALEQAVFRVERSLPAPLLHSSPLSALRQEGRYAGQMEEPRGESKVGSATSKARTVVRLVLSVGGSFPVLGWFCAGRPLYVVLEGWPRKGGEDRGFRGCGPKASDGGGGRAEVRGSELGRSGREGWTVPPSPSLNVAVLVSCL